jgi:hypothetical protein
MSFFTVQTKVVHLDEQNSVTVKRMTYGERQTAIDLGTVVDGRMEPVVHVGRMKQAMLHSAIVSWDGPGFEGRPVTPDNINALPPEIADRIATAADVLMAGLTEDEKKA